MPSGAAIGPLRGVVMMHVDVLLLRIELERVRVRSRFPIEADWCIGLPSRSMHVGQLRFSVGRAGDELPCPLPGGFIVRFRCKVTFFGNLALADNLTPSASGQQTCKQNASQASHDKVSVGLDFGLYLSNYSFALGTTVDVGGWMSREGIVLSNVPRMQGGHPPYLGKLPASLWSLYNAQQPRLP